MYWLVYVLYIPMIFPFSTISYHHLWTSEKNWTLFDIVGCVVVYISGYFQGYLMIFPFFTLQLSQARLLSTRLQRELQVHLASSASRGMGPMKNGNFPTA